MADWNIICVETCMSSVSSRFGNGAGEQSATANRRASVCRTYQGSAHNEQHETERSAARATPGPAPFVADGLLRRWSLH